MRDVFSFFFFLLIMTILSHTTGHAQHNKSEWRWSTMISVPDELGYAGAFAGQIDAGILLLGGANFLDGKMPWEGGTKHWTDKIYYLKSDGSDWRICGKLPVQLGYGASTSIDNSVFIAGGSNELGHHDKVYCMTMENDVLHTVMLPSLPITLANMSSILIGRIWYIVGGQTKPGKPQAENVCYSLNLEQPEDGWKICEPLPGEGRMLAVLGTDGTSLYVFSGVALRDGQRHYLQDAYRYQPGDGWHILKDLPRAVAAAPSPCFYNFTTQQFFIFGGDDGELAHLQLGISHPGFSNKIMMFDVEQQKWYDELTMLLPDILPPVTTTAIIEGNKVVLPMGEVKPGVRTTNVIQGNMTQHQTQNQ